MNRFFQRRIYGVLLLVMTGLSSCTFLPSNGPSLSRVKANAVQKKHSGHYVFITVSQKVTEVLEKNRGSNQIQQPEIDLTSSSATMRSLFREGTPELLGGKPSDRVVQGDVVNVSIFDQGGSLFATPIMPNGLSQTGAIRNDLPPQLVDNTGTIMVPYAGRIMAKGMTIPQIQNEIQNKLKGKTVDPQVVVSLSSRQGGNLVSVLGDVKSPGSIQVSVAGTRLLDSLAQTGGSTGKEYETVVSVIRGGVSRSSLLSEIYDSPSKNIVLEFGDTVIVRNRPLNFLSFGASGQLAEVPFGEDHLTLAKALAKISGVEDSKGNPSGVLLYRLEPRNIVLMMGFQPVGNEAYCPVIYRLDLTQGDGFFLARNFIMRDHDIIYSTTAQSVGVQKFLSLIGAIFSPVSAAGGAAAGAASIATKF